MHFLLAVCLAWLVAAGDNSTATPSNLTLSSTDRFSPFSNRSITTTALASTCLLEVGKAILPLAPPDPSLSIDFSGSIDIMSNGSVTMRVAQNLDQNLTYPCFTFSGVLQTDFQATFSGRVTTLNDTGFRVMLDRSDLPVDRRCQGVAVAGYGRVETSPGCYATWTAD